MTAEPRALPDEVVVAIANAAYAAGDLLVADDMDAAIEYAKACDVALRDAILAALAAEREAAEARGRAAALAEVDAACEALEGPERNRHVIGDFVAGRIRPETLYRHGHAPKAGDRWWAASTGSDAFGPTPTAAILAAAAALDADAGEVAP